MDLLGTGIECEELPDSYVIFICDFDPFELGKYRYTIRHTLKENGAYEYEDGSHTIFLSTVGNNAGEVPTALVRFLKYVGAKLENINDDYDDMFVRQLQQSVEKIKIDREMWRRYMLFEEMMRDEYKAGKAEGIKEGIKEGRKVVLNSITSFLKDIGSVSESLERKISAVDDIKILEVLVEKATRADSITQFEAELDALTESIEPVKLSL